MQRKKDNLTAAQMCWLVVGVIVVMFLLVLLSAVIFQALTWNIGVVGLAAACGLVVSKISLHTAIGAVFLTMLLRGIFSGGPYSRRKDGDKS